MIIPCLVFLASVVVLAACGGSSGPDLGPADAAASMDAPADAPAPDAMSACPGMLELTGGYVDWDSTDATFDGVEFAEMSEVGDPSNTATTAPNGRGTLCLPATGVSQVMFVQPEYLPLRYAVSPEAARFGPFTMRGLKPARADTLFVELGLVRDPTRAQVLVAVHGGEPGKPAVGAAVAIASTNDGAFTANEAGIYVSGDTITDDLLVLIANVDPGAGTAPLSITPPAGMTCAAPAELFVQPGEVAATTVACQ